MSEENDEVGEEEICDLLTEDCKIGLAAALVAQVADWCLGHGRSLDDQEINDAVREVLKGVLESMPTVEALEGKFDTLQAAMDAVLAGRGPKN